MEITLKELKQWRLRAQYLTENAEAIQVAGDLCGIQSQYAANAVHALRIRSKSITMKGLVKSWTLRGTLHLFPAKDLPLYRSYTGVEGIFPTDYGKWLYDGHCQVSKERMLYFAQLVTDNLSDTPVTREDLKVLCRQTGMAEEEEERVFSGWGGVIRLLAESGVLCVSADVNRAYLRCPNLPDTPREQADAELLRRYVTHYGPVTLHDAVYFFRWSQKKIRALLDGLQVKTLTCEGRAYYYLVHPEALPPVPRCIFLAGFDPLLLGYEKKESLYLPPEHLKKIFNNTGIVFPSLLVDGVVRGKWKEQSKCVEITLFEPLNKSQLQAVRRECRRLWPEKQLVMTE